MTKISDLTALTGAGVDSAADLIPIVDMSEAGAARNKNITVDELKIALGVPAAYTDEQVRDVIAAALVAGTNITITPNDGADTITIDAAAGGGLTAEQVMDQVAAMLSAGSNITLTYDDALDTLTIAATGGGGATTLDDLIDVDLTGAATGDVLTKDAGGDWVAAAPSGGGGGGSGALVFLGSHNFSGVSSVDIEDFAGLTGYGKILIEIEELVHAVETPGTNIRFKLGGAYITAANYRFVTIYYYSPSGNSLRGDNASDSIILTAGGAGGMGGAAGEGFSGTITLYNPYSTTGFKRIAMEGQYWDDQSPSRSINVDGKGGYYGNAADALGGIRLYDTSGNNMSGKINVYGVATS